MLTFVFASFLAAVPLLMAFVAIMTTFVPLLLLTQVADVSPVVQFLIVLIGLGVAIDYSLLVVTRWREERTHGAQGEAAVQGRWRRPAAPWSSAASPSRSDCSPCSRYRSPSCARWATAGCSSRSSRWRVRSPCCPWCSPSSARGWTGRTGEATTRRAWTRWAEAVARRRWLAAGAGLAARSLMFAATDIRLGIHDADTLAQSGDAKEALIALEDAGVGEGALLPHEILIEGDTSPSRSRRSCVDRGHPRRGRARRPDWRRDGATLVEAIPVPDSGTDEARRPPCARPRTLPARTCASAASRPRPTTSSTRSTATSR